jgi:hypothetical protein
MRRLHGGQAPAADRHARDVEQDPDHDQHCDDHDDHSENISQRLELDRFRRTNRIAAVDAHTGKKRTFAAQALIKTRPSNPASYLRR